MILVRAAHGRRARIRLQIGHPAFEETLRPHPSDEHPGDNGDGKPEPNTGTEIAAML